MSSAFFIHDPSDSVGVAVRDITKGETVEGWIMSNDDTVNLKAITSIPLGHKIAVTDIGQGERVIKYSYPIGKTTKAVAKGEHVHTHNLKSARW